MQYHFIPNTHLDREWTLDFQHTRKLTIDFLDRLLEIMEAIPDYTFLLDAQAVPLEDYLEVRPENRLRLRELIGEGRISAGPWYCALDTNCLAGESIVRNLRWGHLTVEPFGPVMKVGYTPFGWGQCSQLPQIYQGFGIEVGFFYRGVTAAEIPRAEFIWEGADGSEILTSRFGTGARYNFYFDVWRKALYGDDGHSHRINRRLSWEERAVPFKLCDAAHRSNHGYLYPEERKIDETTARRSFRDLAHREAGHFGIPHIAMMHGMDTSTPDLRERDVVAACQRELGADESFTFSSLPAYAEAMQSACAGQNLPRHRGEARHVQMNDFGFSYIANDIISARTRQKAFTTEVENSLVRQAEPFAAMAWLLDTPWPEAYLDLAWRGFLKCHPHDTIGGCGIDRIERDAMSRLEDVQSLTTMITSESLMAVQGRLDSRELPVRSLVITVFNSSPYVRTETVEAYLDIPREYAWEGYALRDHAGTEVAFQMTPTGARDKVYRDHADLALMSFTDEYRLQFAATAVPGLGYKTYVLLEGAQGVGAVEATGENWVLENEHLRATVNPDGTVDLVDKASGELYPSLNYFEDGGQVGHAWTFVPPANDWVIDSRRAEVVRRVVVRGAVATEIECTLEMRIPRTTPLSRDRFDWRRTTRESQDLIALPLTVKYRLATGDRSLGIEVSFDNQATNHRLRALFPTGVKSDESFAEAPFDVVTRRAVRDEKNPYRAFPHLTFPMVRFAGVGDGRRCLAVLAGGLKEYELRDDPERTLALTLHRGFENRMCTSGDFDLEHTDSELSQGLGRHHYRYRLMVGDPGESWEAVFREAETMHAPFVASQTRPRAGDQPLEAGMLEHDNPVVQVSALTRAARTERLLLRLFNPSSQRQETTLRFARAPLEVWSVNLNEEGGEPLPCAGNRVVATLPPKKIVTLAISFAA